MSPNQQNPRSSSSSAPSSERQLVTPQLVLDTLRHWWLLALPVGLLLAAAAGAGVYFALQPRYQAEVLMRIRQEQLGFPWDGARNDRNFARNQIALIRSSPVLGPVVARPEVFELPEVSEGQDDPVKALAKLVAISDHGGSNLYRLTCTASTPRSAALVANAVAEEYLNILGDQEARRSQELIQLLGEELVDAERRADESWTRVRQMTMDQTGRDPFAPEEDLDPSARLSLNALQSRIMLVEAERTYEKVRLEAAERRLEEGASGVTDAMVDEYLNSQPQVDSMQQRIQQVTADLGEIKLKSRLGDQDPLYASKTAERERLSAIYEDMREELRGSAQEELDGMLAGRQETELADMRDRLRDYDLQLEVLNEQYREELSNLKNFTGVTLDLEVERDELDRSRSLVNSLNDRIFALRTQLRAPPRVELLERAKPPVLPSDTPIKKALAAGAGAFGIPFVLALLWEVRLRRLSTPDQLEEAGRLPVLGETARFPVRRINGNATGRSRAGRALRTFEESVEQVRHSVTLAQPLREARVLGITSAISQEGKTTLAVQLAVSLAKATGEPTLLVDADMRAPDVHHAFDLPLEPGLATLLGSDGGLEDSIHSTWLDNLHVIPGGRLAASPHRLLGNGELDLVMRTLRERYRHIVLDTPPVLGASESLKLLSEHADATILCTMRDVSRADQVRKASFRLAQAGAKVVGCVFNGVPRRTYEYAYGKYAYQ